MVVLTATVLPATTGNNSPASGEYETIISEITGFTQVKHFYVHFVGKTTLIKIERSNKLPEARRVLKFLNGLEFKY